MPLKLLIYLILPELMVPCVLHCKKFFHHFHKLSPHIYFSHFSKLLQKRKPDGTLLEIHSQEEADGRKAVEDRTNHSEFCLRDNRDECTYNKTGQFAKEQAKPEPFEGVNDSALGKLAVVPLPGVPIPTDEQTLITTPSAKLVSNVENDNTDMVASMKKNISVTKKKAIQNTDSKEKFGGMPSFHLCTCG